jgi:hypothetical protein
MWTPGLVVCSSKHSPLMKPLMSGRSRVPSSTAAAALLGHDGAAAVHVVHEGAALSGIAVEPTIAMSASPVRNARPNVRDTADTLTSNDNGYGV